MISLARRLWSTTSTGNHGQHLLFLSLLGWGFETPWILRFSIWPNRLDTSLWYDICVTLTTNTMVWSQSWRWMLYRLCLGETRIFIWLIKKAVSVWSLGATNQCISQRPMHYWVMLHRIIVLLVKTEASVYCRIGLTVSWLLHDSTHWHFFLSFKWIHIHRFGNVAFMFTARILCLLSFYPISATLKTDWWAILSSIKLDDRIVDLNGIKEWIIYFLSRCGCTSYTSRSL